MRGTAASSRFGSSPWADGDVQAHGAGRGAESRASRIGRFLVHGLLDGEHTLRIEPIEKQRSRFIQQERFAGILVGLFQEHPRQDRDLFRTRDAASRSEPKPPDRVASQGDDSATVVCTNRGREPGPGENPADDWRFDPDGLSELQRVLPGVLAAPVRGRAASNHVAVTAAPLPTRKAPPPLPRRESDICPAPPPESGEAKRS